MNERIKELAEQAAQQSALIENDTSLEVTVNEKSFYIPANFIEQFAKLVVADCVKITEGYCEVSPEIYGLPLDILEHFDMELDE